MSHVLVVDDAPDQAMMAKLLLEKRGYKVEMAHSGRDALAAMDRLAFDIVVTDFLMPGGMHGLELIEATQVRYPNLPIVLVTSYGSEDLAAQAFKKGAASYIPKRHLQDELVDTLANILAISEAGKGRQTVLKYLAESEYRFQLESDLSLVPSLVAYMDEILSARFANQETEIFRSGMALSEALMNAICHGNLQVNSSLREDDPSGYRDELRRRQRLAPYKDRQVQVRARVSPTDVTYEVRDQGPGFDRDRLLDPTAPENLMKLSGRGLYLIHTFMDHVDHNESGNEIRMRKRFNGRASESS